MAQVNERVIQAPPINLDEVQPFLQGVSYPATKREILDVAYDNGAPDHILDALNRVPDQEYYGDTDLMFTLEDTNVITFES